eukprot:m.27607 g.27607  ORF g.27607 m.27607 type:complete len:459 (-) comp4428_c0_seq1:46-1422(-)
MRTLNRRCNGGRTIPALLAVGACMHALPHITMAFPAGGIFPLAGESHTTSHTLASIGLRDQVDRGYQNELLLSTGQPRRITEVSTCDDMVVHGGSDAVLDAIVSLGAALEDGSVKFGVVGGDKKAFAEALRRAMVVAAGAGTDDDGTARTHVVTAQIGANDGKQNDPFHKHMVLGDVKRDMLKSWIPIMFEPSPYMFDKLTRHWRIMSRVKSSACFMALRRPAMYPGETTCPFFYFNNSHIDGATKICKKCTRCEDHARYMREQLGSLDEQSMRRYFGPNFDRCIAEEQLSCGPLSTVVNRLNWDSEVQPRIDVLHIDAEGYDGVIINGILSAPIEVPPPIIYFEAKVMRTRIRSDKEQPYSCAFMDLFDRLRADGRHIVYDGGEDALAIKMTTSPAQPWQPRNEGRCRAQLMEKYPNSWGKRKHALYPERRQKIEIWNALLDCCSPQYYRVEFETKV